MEEEKKEEVVEKTEEISNKELVQKTQELEETTDRLKRLMAEFDNYKKRTAKERESLYNSILSDVVSSLLPVVDNFEKAVSVESSDLQYKQGVELVNKQLLDVLSSLGIERIPAVGQTFDPEIHDAVSHIEDENLGEQEIKEEFRPGYKIGDKVIRHSMVVVAN